MLSIRRIRAMYLKDLRDAIRDSRVLIALLLPFGIGIFYNLTFKDETTSTIHATVVYASDGATALPDLIQRASGPNVVIAFRETTEDRVRPIVGNEDADLGLIIPAGFDAAVTSGVKPDLTVVQRARATVEGQVVAAAIEPALRALAGQPAPAAVNIEAAGRTAANAAVTNRLGLRTWAVLAAVVMMIAMVGMLALPVILAEETERKTLDALVLVSNYAEVILAKALVGVTYVVVMVPLLLKITGIRPHSLPLFAAAVGLLAIVLMGIGLLMAGLFKSANQLNTWSGLLLLPVVAPAFAVGLPAPHVVSVVLGALPSGAAAKLLFNSATPSQIFPNPAAYFAILAAWGVAAYLLLLWRLSRRQA